MSVRLMVLLALILAASNAMALEVAMTATASDDAQVMVSGTTNLPDGTELLVTLSDAERVYRTNGKVIVTGGTFRSQPFTPPLCTECSLNIISQIAAYQPAKVRSVIGDCGEALTGQHVVKGSVGGLVVSYHATVTLSKWASARRSVTAANPKLTIQKKTPSFNRYSSYRALRAAGRRDLPPLPDTSTRR